MKRFYIQNNVGMAKYLVCYHDGEKQHRDGSDFFDIVIIKNKKKLAKFTINLWRNGYIETGIYGLFMDKQEN